MTKMTRLYFLPTILLVIHLVLILTSGNSTLVRRGCTYDPKGVLKDCPDTDGGKRCERPPCP